MTLSLIASAQGECCGKPTIAWRPAGGPEGLPWSDSRRGGWCSVMDNNTKSLVPVSAMLRDRRMTGRCLFVADWRGWRVDPAVGCISAAKVNPGPDVAGFFETAQVPRHPESNQPSGRAR